jgi:hypothetical protein
MLNDANAGGHAVALDNDARCGTSGASSLVMPISAITREHFHSLERAGAEFMVGGCDRDRKPSPVAVSSREHKRHGARCQIAGTFIGGASLNFTPAHTVVLHPDRAAVFPALAAVEVVFR